MPVLTDRIGLKHGPSEVKIQLDMATLETVVGIDSSVCGQCGGCVSVCGARALYLSSIRLELNPKLCDCCGDCIIICPVGALSFDN